MRACWILGGSCLWLRFLWLSRSRSCCRLEIDDCVDVVDFIFPGFQWYVVRMDNSSCCVSGIDAVERKVGPGESVTP
jgi:hypothetical protein